MPIPKYSYNGPVDPTVEPDKTKVKGRSVIITGGVNGMGKVVMVREFVAAGAFMTFCDLHPRGADLEELNSNGENIAFVKCDIRSWDDHIKLSETAKNKSQSKSVAVVIANAGISRSSGDSLHASSAQKATVGLRDVFFARELEVYIL